MYRLRHGSQLQFKRNVSLIRCIFHSFRRMCVRYIGRYINGWRERERMKEMREALLFVGRSEQLERERERERESNNNNNNNMPLFHSIHSGYYSSTKTVQ